MKKNTKKIQENDRKFGTILGINVLSTTTLEVLASVEGFLSHSQRFSILTPNPELILMAQKNKELKESLNSADLPIPDGIGLKLAIPGLTIIKGRELFLELIKLANGKSWKVFLLGGMDDEAKLAAQQLTINNSQFTIETDKGPKLNQKGEPLTGADSKLEREVIKKINNFKPQLLFVAFGNPKQEIWIHKNLSKLNVGGAMAVGGTFRYIAGLSKLPPKWMEKVGLEWLWRLITEPERWRRIWNAVVVFPIKVICSKIA